MGNTVGAQPKWTPSTTSEYLAELREEGAPVPRRLLWSGRFVKTLECVSGASLSGSPSCEAIARVYLKRDTRTEHSELQRSLSLTSRARSRLLAHSSSDPPHTLPAQRVADCPRAVYLLRQKTHQTLASRIGSRPFPSTSEKRWLAYQLLRAVQQAHSCGIAHGDIKAENCALTSWSWLLLIDFATHKPAFLPRDNPSEFSFFFDTGSRRRCYVAPERFLSSDSDAWFQETSDSSSASTSEEQPSGPVRIQPTTFAADVFSAGCVIAELFLNGVALFDLSSLLTYSAEHHSESLELVDQIDEPDCRELVRSMIALNPEMRPSAYECLQTQLGRLFPRFFETELHPLMGRALQMSPNERIASFLDRHLSLCRYMCADKGWYHHVNQFLVDTTANVHMIEQVLKSDSALALPCGHWQWYRPKNVNDTSSGDQRSKSSMSNGCDALLKANPTPETCEHMTLIVAILCALLRGCSLISKKLQAISTLRSDLSACDDSTRLQLGAPVFLSMVYDKSASVRAAAIRAATATAVSVEHIPQSDARVFPEYILPSLSMVPYDNDPLVRVALATTLGPLCDAANGRVDEAEQARARAVDGSFTDDEHKARIASHRDAVQDAFFASMTSFLASSDISCTPFELRALLRNLRSVTKILTPERLKNRVLPLLASCLHDSNWRTRDSFFLEVASPGEAMDLNDVGNIIATSAHEGYRDPEFDVVASSLDCLSILMSTPRESSEKMEWSQVSFKTVLDFCRRASVLLCHPSQPVRHACSRLLASFASVLGRADAFAWFMPYVEDVLECNITPKLLEQPHTLSALSKQPATLDEFRSAIKGEGSSLSSNRFERRGYSPTSQSMQNEPTWEEGLHVMDSYVREIVVHGGRTCSSPAVDRSLDAQRHTSPVSTHETYGDNSSTVHSRHASQNIEEDTGLSYDGKRKESPRYHLYAGPMVRPTKISPVWISDDGSPEVYNGSHSKGSAAVRNHEYSQHSHAGHPLPRANTLADYPSDEDQAVSVESSGRLVPTQYRDSMAQQQKSDVARPEHATGRSDASGTSVPYGRLVAQLSEHSSAVTSLTSIARNHAFVSTALDGTAKLWDMRSLAAENSFSSARDLFVPRGRLMASCTMSTSDHLVAIASSKGVLHFQSVHRDAASGGTLIAPEEGVRSTHLHEGSLLQMHEQEGLVLCATESAKICAYDPRAGKVVQRIKCDPRDGVLTSMVGSYSDASWVISGTSCGVFGLWDLRFMIPANRWSLPQRSPVSCMCLSQSRKHSSSVTSPLVWAAAGREEVALWSAVDGSCKQVLRKEESEGMHGKRRPAALEQQPAGEQEVDLTAIVDSVEERPPGPRTILPLVGSDGEESLLTAGSDCCVRVWTPDRPERCGVLATPAPMQQRRYSVAHVDSVRVLKEREEPIVRAGARGAASWDNRARQAHQEEVAAAGRLDDSFIATGSRDGVINLWQ